jgi:ParB-like chromosome segregation protein Spo0J
MRKPDRPESKSDPRSDGRIDGRTDGRTDARAVLRPDSRPDADRPSGQATGPAYVNIARPEAVDVATERLIADPKNRPIDEREASFLELADSVRALGILVRLQVVARADGGFDLIDGERRLRVAQRLRLASVPCDLWPLGTPRETVLAAGLAINEHRAPHGILAVARRLRELKNEHGAALDEIAKKTGISIDRVKQYSSLLGASDPLLALFDSEDVPLTVAVQLVRFEKAAGEAASRRLASEYRERPLSVREIADRRSKHEAAQKDSAGCSEPETAPAARPRLVALKTVVTKAFERDPVVARLELEAVALELGFRLVPVEPKATAASAQAVTV